MILKQNILSDITDYKYSIHFTKSDDEIEKALELRRNVFYNELNRQFTEQNDVLDIDRYDHQCHHMVVIENSSKDVVGTYRFQTYENAIEGNGFFTDERFHIGEMPLSVQKKGVEVGRACIRKDHRNGRVLFLMWKGIARYMQHFNKRYLFGYSAFSESDPDFGRMAKDYFRRQNLINPDFYMQVRDSFVCETEYDRGSCKGDIELPVLFDNYIKVGARICGGPSLDRELELIHFVIILDLEKISDRTRKLFFG